MIAYPPWEVGSGFPLTLVSEGEQREAFSDGRLFGSGRQALRAVLAFGRQQYGWTAAHLPTYYCPDVVDSLTGILPVKLYDASPAGDFLPPVVGHRDVVVLVSFFGQFPGRIGQGKAASIIDATHDPLAPWINDTQADYVFASLRKTLPLPDGGVAWSPLDKPLPDIRPATEEHLTGTGHMLSAMCLKAGYLAGQKIAKKQYLDLIRLAEAQFGSSEPCEMSAFSQAVLPTFPIDEWRRQRIGNIAALGTAVAGLDDLHILPSSFGVVLRFPSHEWRDAIQSGLIANGVYPAILWDLRRKAVPEHHQELSRQLLFLHADFRWSRGDMARVAELVRQLHTAYVPIGVAGTAR